MTVRFPRIGQLLCIAVVLATAGFKVSCAVAAISTTPEETVRRNAWLKERFLDAKPQLPFSFTYDGKKSQELLAGWPKTTTTKRLDDVRTQHVLSWTDSKTGLDVRCVAVESAGFPVVEWTLYFKNAGNKNTPILSDIQALDAVFRLSGPNDPVLHHFRGDNCTKDSFQPFCAALAPGFDRSFAPAGGRPSTGEWPYYNLEADGGGAILAIGWPGQWKCRFTRNQDKGVRIRAGQELTRFTLHPGEEVRTPLIALMFYQRDWISAQNLWRRWMFAQNFPKDHGKPSSPKLAGFAGNYFPGYRTNQKGEIEFIDRYVEERLRPDYWWIDAGWYPCVGDWGPVGTWEVDRVRFPDGLRAVSNHARSNGMEFILWFEPERVASNTWLAKNHPEWILGGAKGGLLNFGNPEAWKWITERIDSLIVSEGVDVYRQDFNIDPLGYWRGNDAPDRQGITEIKHVQGYLAFWDELRRRHPGMIIDSCASGGRRNDLESMRRALPFLRSDYRTDADGMQCHTYGFNLWLPYYRGAFDKIDPYDFRSNISPLMMAAWDMRNKNLDYALARKLVGQWRQVAPCLFGDFYPLTDYSLASNTWIAWQFDLPEKREGFVQAFRRDKNEESTKRLFLHGLDPAATYEVVDLDAATPAKISGKDLMEKGLTVEIKSKPGAVVIAYTLAK